MDQDLYAALVKQRLPQIETNANTVYDLEKAVTSVNHVLTKCADDAAPRQQRRARKAKLRVWTPEIKAAITRMHSIAVRRQGDPKTVLTRSLFRRG